MSEPISKVSLVKTERLPTIAQAIAEGERVLAGRGTDSPRLDAEVLLAHARRCRRTQLFIHYDAPVRAASYRRYEALLARRARGEPVAYITGTREFWGLEFTVSPDVLIPRPETEHLVEQALERLRADGPSPAPILVDVGTGSGCLSVALAKECPTARVIAIDISAPALRVAQANARQHGVRERVAFVQSDGLTALRARPAGVDLIVCNPPYIPRAEFEALPPAVRDFEPRRALTDESDGLVLYRRIIAEALELLRPGGHLIFELGAGHAGEVRGLWDARAWEIIRLVKDLQGIDRVLVARSRAGIAPRGLEI